MNPSTYQRFVMVTPPPLLHVARRATRQDPRETRLLSEWGDASAYVLLGDPGAGKSSSFKVEAEACAGVLITARDIVDGVAEEPETTQTVFIDGLDEVRAGVSDPKAPFGLIRKWLHDRRYPKFRLSCREADWLGGNDSGVLPEVQVLHLEPLTRDDIFDILCSRSAEVPDPERFWTQAQHSGLTDMFGNPLLLDLMITATQGGNNWPATRLGIFDAACRQLAKEKNESHRGAAQANAKTGDEHQLLHHVGLVCAVLLLSQTEHCTLHTDAPPPTVALSGLPLEFSKLLHSEKSKTLLANKLFTSTAGRYAPRHRSIAEFLAGKALAERLSAGLPLGRLLAYMQTSDGNIALPLRGLLAWLAVHHVHAPDRARLMALDPLAIVLNGDAAALSKAERTQLLDLLRQAAQRNRWFCKDVWVSHPFGALASWDMEDTFKALLRERQRDPSHLAFMACVFDALRHGQAMPGLAPGLVQWVEDGEMPYQAEAYKAWKHNLGNYPVEKQRYWLDKITEGALPDSPGRLTAALLTDLYPQALGPGEIWNYLQPLRLNETHSIRHFWSDTLVHQSRKEDFALLADAWAAYPSKPENNDDNYDLRNLNGKVLVAALAHAGADIPTKRLFAWLEMIGWRHYTLHSAEENQVALWLQERPDRMKDLAAYTYQHTPPEEWPGLNQTLHGAGRPRDWLRWHMDLTASTQNEALAEYVFNLVAGSVIDPDIYFDTPDIEDMERWIQAQKTNHPKAQAWRAKRRHSPLDAGRGYHHRLQLRAEAESRQTNENCQRAFAPHLEDLANGIGPAGWQSTIAKLVDRETTNHPALAQIQAYLKVDQPTAQRVIDGLPKVLSRTDLPSAQSVLKAAAKNQVHKLRTAVLVAANHRAQDPQAWPDDLTQTIAAFYLTNLDSMRQAKWYPQLIEHRPELVAKIALKASKKFRIQLHSLYLHYAKQSYIPASKKPPIHPPNIYPEHAHQSFVRLVLPTVLGKFPKLSDPVGRAWLHSDLLAALTYLEPTQAKKIIQKKLALEGLDAMQRIAWLVADLPYRAQAASELARWVGKSELRAVELGEALYSQGSFNRTRHTLPPASIGHMLKVLAPITRGQGIYYVGATTPESHCRQQVVHGLFGALTNDPSPEAGAALQNLLKSQHRFKHWETDVKLAIYTQHTTAQQTSFAAPTPEQIAKVIANSTPANAADLQALVVHHLKDIEHTLKGDPTFALKQFWKDQQTPELENNCRDQLLGKLSPKLEAMTISLHSEVRAAQDKRADMCAGFMSEGKSIKLPIEVKRASDPKLWSACSDQLKRFYTNDPTSQGYGLYLVLWFDHQVKASPEGLKPVTPQALRDALIQHIPETDRNQLAVVVMDLSWPEELRRQE
jgi:hypothetical protein